MTMLKLCAPAKINLFLHIIGRRSDGYHALQTAFQLLDFGDLIKLQLTSDPSIRLLGSMAGIDESDNLVIRAAQLLHAQAKQPVSGVEITLEKRIPIGGGLGGGSSNAASTLLGLNQLWNLQLPLEQLAELGLSLGADVPVFIFGKSSFAEGVGEQLQPLKMPKKWFLVLKPPVSVPTGVIFSHSQLTRDTRAIKMLSVFTCREKTQGNALPLLSNVELNPELVNDCESVVRMLYPAVDQALKWLNQHAKARLTGTGACVFASFSNYERAASVMTQIPSGYTGFIAQGLDYSLTHEQLYHFNKK